MFNKQQVAHGELTLTPIALSREYFIEWTAIHHPESSYSPGGWEISYTSEPEPPRKEESFLDEYIIDKIKDELREETYHD